MQKQLKLISILIIAYGSSIFSSDLKPLDPESLKQHIATSYWQLYVQTHLFDSPHLCLQASPDSKPIEFQIYEPELAKQITNESFPNFPPGISGTLKEILSGQNTDEIFKRTPTHVHLLDKTNPHNRTTFRCPVD